jgi:hypothetical protein
MMISRNQRLLSEWIWSGHSPRWRGVSRKAPSKTALFTPVLNPDYRDILSIFKVGVDYLIVGAYALAAHGHPHATGDIDLWVEASSENSKPESASVSKK